MRHDPPRAAEAWRPRHDQRPACEVHVRIELPGIASVRNRRPAGPIPLDWNFAIESIDSGVIQNTRQIPCREKARLVAGFDCATTPRIKSSTINWCHNTLHFSLKQRAAHHAHNRTFREADIPKPIRLEY